MHDDERDIDQLEALEEKNRERIEGWWGAIGQEPAYPATTDQAVRLCRAAGYDVSGDTALAYVNEQIIPPVCRRGRLEWQATNVVTLACALEARRKWQPFSQIHRHKLTKVEMVQQIAEHQGGSAFSDLAAFDIEGLLGWMISVSHDQQAVQCLTEALREKLKAQGVI